MLLLLHAYITYAGKLQQASQHRQLASELAKAIVDKYVSIPNMTDKKAPNSTETVYLYAAEVITLGLLWHGFHAIKEGDGVRILQYWKFFLVAFKATGHRNHAKEEVNLLYQYYYVFSERKKSNCCGAGV